MLEKGSRDFLKKRIAAAFFLRLERAYEIYAEKKRYQRDSEVDGK